MSTISPFSRPSRAACRGSRWRLVAAATAACLPPTVTARARWLLGCRSQRRWTSAQRVSAIFPLMLWTNLISQRGRLNHASGLTISLLNPESRIDDHLMTYITLNVFVGANFFIFRARTMPVQPDRAEPVIAESGDSAEDTISAQLHRYAGEKKNTHLDMHRYREQGKLFSSVSRFVWRNVCVWRSLYRSGNDGGVSV